MTISSTARRIQAVAVLGSITVCGCSDPIPTRKDKGADVHIKAGKGTNITEPSIDVKVKKDN